MAIQHVDFFSEQTKRVDLHKSIGLKKSNYRQFGIPENNSKHVDTLKELSLTIPNIVIAKALINVQYVQNDYSTQEFKKGTNYVMGIGTFESMQYDPKRRYRKTGKNVRILKPSEVPFKNVFKPYRGQTLDGKTLLVWRTGGIGDLLFIKPNLDYLKEEYPTCTIKFACGPLYQSMVKEWKCVDKVIDLPFTNNVLFRADYHCIFEGVIERTKEAESVNAYELFTRWMNLNLPTDLLIPKQTPNDKIVRECENILKNKFINKNEFILMQLRASSPPRTPNPSFWAQLIDKLIEDGNHQIVLTDIPGQERNIQAIKDMCKYKDKIELFVKESKTVAHLIAMASLAKMTISPDSSLIHIAESVGTKNFGIYGPFLGRIRLSTYKNNDWVDCDKYPCAPCFIHNHKPCKNAIEGFSPCYSVINIDECISKINRLLHV